MNLSGKAVQYWMQAEKIPADKVLIITDDLALPFGKIRIRAKGSGGGHNGIKSIIESLGNQSFPRLRFGISDEFAKGNQISYVLGKWTGEELTTLSERIDICCDAIKNFTFNPIGRVMNVFNSK